MEEPQQVGTDDGALRGRRIVAVLLALLAPVGATAYLLVTTWAAG